MLPGSSGVVHGEETRREATRSRFESAREERLVERAQRGEGPAFAELYQRHVDRVYAYVRLRVRDESTAMDLTQEAFLAALRGLGGFRWQGSFAPWLLRIAHNVVADYWRGRAREPDLVRLPGEDDADDSLPQLAAEDESEEQFDLAVSPAIVASAVAELSDLQRQVVALRFGAGLSLAETAQTMDRSVGAVKNLQYKALGALRRGLERRMLAG